MGEHVIGNAGALALLLLWCGCQGSPVLVDGVTPCDAASIDADSSSAETGTGTPGPFDATSAPDATSVTDAMPALDATLGEQDASGVGTDAASTDAAVDGTSVADAPESATSVAEASDHCMDGKQDFDESDVDCGGSCAPCPLGDVCFADTDCSPTGSGCDVDAGGCYCLARNLVCVASHCLDKKKDADETAIDCGGRTCAGCGVGVACFVDSDCASEACDAISQVCDSGQCADRHQDGDESDVDCGGSCNGCDVGQMCHTNFDCQSGHFCQHGDGAASVCQ